MGHAILERALLVGTRSADHIRASSRSGCIATGKPLREKQAAYMAAPERFAERSDSSCTAGTVHTFRCAAEFGRFILRRKSIGFCRRSVPP
jgi:hypothetical protein